VDRLLGIGPKTAAALAAVGVGRIVDLLHHLPKRYEDRGSVLPIAAALESEQAVLLHGRLTARAGRYVRRRLHITDGELVDDSGRVAVRWFNQPWIADRFQPGAEAFVYGSISRTTGRVRLVNPEIEVGSRSREAGDITAIYPRLGPLTGKRLRTIMDRALACLGSVGDPVPRPVRRELALPDLAAALTGLHRPTAPGEPGARERLVRGLNSGRSPAHRRLAFDELLTVACVVAGYRMRRRSQRGIPITVPSDFEQTAASLFEFELTAAQRRAVTEIVSDLQGPTPMARLLQGDVGSGKTAVATLALLAAVAGGRQAALMAPTELLAEQLHRSVASKLEPLGFEIRLLTGSAGAGESRSVRADLVDGSIDAVVGTHALFQERISFDDLGLVVIDEQHRFGVAQRQRLLDKGSSPHLLVMTATPIPRSLALTLYGDLDLTVIDELPPGRRPVRTEIRDVGARTRILEFLRSEVDDGGRCFIVCPAIGPSPRVEAVSLAEIEPIVRDGLGGIEVGVLHGRMGSEERESIARRFRDGELKILLATTVIEVGVDVPAATVMLVENADRFGLSQLHQLRGRVGRGSRQSWCILVTGDHPTENARRRLQVLERTNDGFEIAEADLRHRGPGELTGIRQWGAESLRFADLTRDGDLIRQTRMAARRFADEGILAEVRDRLLLSHPVGEIFTIG
jgi:ATP-dependent DNA helicase RecG